MDKLAELFESAAHETRQGNIKNVIKIYEEIISMSKTDICMLYAKGLKFDEAMVCIEEAQKHEPDNVV